MNHNRGGVQRIEYISIMVDVQINRFDLPKVIMEALFKNGVKLEDRDIIVVSSKFIAMSQGRFVKLKEVTPSQNALELSEQLTMEPALVELVLREADSILGAVNGFILAVKDGALAPNAGIDKSNIFPGWVILYPKNPFKLAEDLRKIIMNHLGIKVGVILADSRLMPTRRGTTGVSVGVAGFEPVIDERGRTDLFGNVLRVTFRAIADSICAGVQLLMCEADEATPLVIVRSHGQNGNPFRMTDRKIRKEEIAVEFTECFYIKGLSESFL